METAEKEIVEPSYEDFKFAQPRLNRMIDAWNCIDEQTDYNRALRYIDVDTENERIKGKLKPDETYVPARICDTNIRREQPQYVGYITQPERSAIFTLPGQEVPNVRELENHFTKVCRYEGWEIPFLETVDGMQTHGWDFVEVVFDPSKPGDFAVEHVGHADLIYHLKARDIQNQELIVRREEWTAHQLKKQPDFNREQVRILTEENNRSDKDCVDVPIEVFKCFYKDMNGAVYYGYYGGKKSTDWLREPMPLFMGRYDLENPPVQDPETGEYGPDVVFETEYPFYKLAYCISENPQITSVFGRAKLDEYSQEAASAVQSGLSNTSIRASNVYGYVDNPAADSASPKQTELVLKHGTIVDRKVGFFTTPQPDPAQVQAFQALVGQNANEQSNVNYAVQNRKDSRKTATENVLAREQSEKLSGVQVLLLSIFMRSVYNRCWRIYRNRVQIGKKIVPPTIAPLFMIEDFIVKSSGDVEVIQRKEKEMKQRQDWPVVSATPIALEFLKDILLLSYPEDGSRYVRLLGVGQMQAAMIQNLLNVIQALVLDPATGQIKPEYADKAEQLQMLAQQAQLAIANGNPQGGIGAPAQSMDQQPGNQAPANQGP